MNLKRYNRELSWLSFNHRVLQEARDKTNPIYERIKFLAIYSSNLDEFFRVRVASIRNLLTLKNKGRKKLGIDADILLKKIHKKVRGQQEEFGKTFYDEIIPELESNNIFIANYKSLTEEQNEFIRSYFIDNILEHIQPVLLIRNKIFPFLQNQALYLIVQLLAKTNNNGSKRTYKYAQVKLPTHYLPRFHTIPNDGEKSYVMFLDDIVRANLSFIFQGYEIINSYAVKITRDASIKFDDYFDDELIKKIKKGVKKRNVGLPSRFLYDNRMPKNVLSLVKNVFHLERNDLIPGGRYHNFSDFFTFPNLGDKSLELSSRRPIQSQLFEKHASVLKPIKKKDELLFFPYQAFEYFIGFLKEAATKKTTKAIYITLYRVAANSKVVKELINACKNGINVVVVVELKARFDEESNINSAATLEEAGAKVIYGAGQLKVHTKVCLIESLIKGNQHFYSYLGTGNFNEKTSKIYSDIGLFTSEESIGKDLINVFNYLQDRSHVDVELNQLFVAPFNMRTMFYSKIDREIEFAKQGKHARIIAKMNSIEDQEIIEKLYEASNAGVQIDLIIRGICCLIPGVKNQSENISITSIVAHYLEHARVFIFENNGNREYYTGSADWMKRNLSKRVEIIFPIKEKSLQLKLQSYIDMQMADNIKARKIDRYQLNTYLRRNEDEKTLNSQVKFREYLKEV